MAIRTWLASLLILTVGACASGPASGPACVDFEPPLTLGTQFGTPVGQMPGDIALTAAGTTVRVQNFRWTSGGSTFNLAMVDNAPVPFSSGQSMRSNNINLEFDLTQLGFSPSEVHFRFLDLGGHENISINGDPSPIFAGEISSTPSSLGGTTVTVSTTPVSGGSQGIVTMRGDVRTFTVGGQEFWIDEVCAQP